MKKKALVLGLALALAISQAAMAVAAGSITVSGGSSGPNKSDMTIGSTVDGSVVNSVSVINRADGSQTDIASDEVKTQDTTNGPAVSVPGGPATGVSAQAAPEVTQQQITEQTAALSGYDTTVTTAFSGYAEGAVNVLNAVNADPASLSGLASAEDLSRYAMLTTFQQIQVKDRQTGNTVSPAAGNCIVITVPALQPGMKVFLLYVDPVTGQTVKVQASGVDYANQLVMIDASVPGAFTVVYEK